MVDALADLLREIEAVELAYLFGSRARGEESPASDVDVAVRLSDAGLLSLAGIGQQLTRAVGRAVHVVDLDAASPVLAMEVARDGVLLLERTAMADQDYRERAAHRYRDGVAAVRPSRLPLGRGRGAARWSCELRS